MPDVIITPSSGIIDFYPSGKTASVYASGNDLVFSNSSGNFEIISGNFGIGTTAPSGKLTVIGSGLVSSITGTVPNALLHAYSTVSGDTVFNVEGTNGSLFSIVDSMSGTLMAVNNNAGLPVFEVFSDDSIVAGRFNQNDLVVSSGGNVGMGTASPSGKLDVRGNAYVSGNLGIGIPSPTGQFQVIGTGNIDTLNIRQPTNNVSAFNIFSSGNAYTHSIYAGSSSYDTVFNFPHTLNCYLNNSAGSFNIYQNSASPTWRFTSTLLQSSFGGASLYAGATGYFGFGTYAGTSNFEVMSIHNRVGNTAWGVGLLYNSGAGLTRGLVLNNIGNVGINTDTPTFQLHVNGSGFIASGLTVTGLLTGNSGNFINSLQVNGTGVSISGHTHTSSNISDFNESVDDRVATLLVAGSGMGLDYNDAGNTLTVNCQTLPTIKQTYSISGTSGTFTVSAGYSVGYLDVYHNGVKLIDNDDYAATNGSTFSLTVPAVSGDVVEALSSRASVVLQTLMAQAYINALNAVTNNVGGMLYLWANYR